MPTPGPLELVIILVIALLVLGPGRLPDVGSALGKSLREFRKAASDVQEATKIDTSPLPPTPPSAADAPAPAAAAQQPSAPAPTALAAQVAPPVGSARETSAAPPTGTDPHGPESAS